jgi:hypothetical protein
MPYGDRWKAHRQLFHSEFNPSAVVRHQPAQLSGAYNFLVRLLNEPDDFISHLRQYAPLPHPPWLLDPLLMRRQYDRFGDIVGYVWHTGAAKGRPVRKHGGDRAARDGVHW